MISIFGRSLLCGLTIIWCLTGIMGIACAQDPAGNKKDTTKNGSIKNFIEENKITQEIVGSITRRPSADTLFTLKSEDVFRPHEGKIIRKIYIDRIGFERSFYNGTKKVRKAIVNVSNALHVDTRQQIIRNHLFIRENKPLNPYKVADNERYLRDLEFILDAQISVIPVSTDSVDLVVTTRDVFSLGGSVGPRSPTEYKFRMYDANFLGYGQRLQFNGLVDDTRSPKFGSEFIYTKSSLGGTLVNLSAGYTHLNTGSSYGDELENAWFLRLSRPLVSPYTRMAGGLELSSNWSDNPFNKPDSLFLNYSYNVYDVWAGYNIGIHHSYKNRARHFVSMRVFRQDFKEHPSQESAAGDAMYNDNLFLLSQLTFFRQNFYKTRYIYGFGRTEDVPYGHSAYITAGWSRVMSLNRPYFGGGLSKKVVNNSGDFYEADLRGATFWRNGNPEDITGLFSLSWFSSLKTWKKYKVRQFVKVSYATIINRSTSQLLYLNNEFGVRGFHADSLRGDSRLGITTETVVFTPWKFLGFKFAPIAFADVAFLSNREAIFYDKPYWGLGAGVRTRNENLIFGTIEFKFTFYPRKEEDLSQFKFSVTTDLRIKYSGSFVRLPSFINANQSY